MVAKEVFLVTINTIIVRISSSAINLNTIALAAAVPSFNSSVHCSVIWLLAADSHDASSRQDSSSNNNPNWIREKDQCVADNVVGQRGAAKVVKARALAWFAWILHEFYKRFVSYKLDKLEHYCCATTPYPTETPTPRTRLHPIIFSLSRAHVSHFIFIVFILDYT